MVASLAGWLFFARLVPVFPPRPVNRRSIQRSLRRLMRGDYFLSYSVCVRRGVCVSSVGGGVSEHVCVHRKCKSVFLSVLKSFDLSGFAAALL